MNDSVETATVEGAEAAGWRSDVEGAARDLAVALAETPQFEAFEHAYMRFRDDERAQEAMRAYQEKQNSLQMMLMLNAASPEQLEELERLRQAWMAEESMVAYLDAQTALALLARSIDTLLSERIGFGFAATCRPSCCGPAGGATGAEDETRAALSPELLAAAGSLAAALERSEPVAALREAKSRLDADERARAMLRSLAEADAELRRRQAEGTLRREDIERVRAAQQEAWSDLVISAFAEAQQEVAAYLPEVNETISELLGWDFAQMASSPASC